MTVCEKKYDTVVGSWYNSGFHGHYRSLPRNYYNTFREISKPSPPRKFSARSQEGPFSHPFTKHDNKKTFTNDIDQLAQSGVKKDMNRSDGKFNKGFMKWDKKHDPALYESCYKRDSRSAPLNFNIKDCMKDWQPLGNKMEFNTMYREHFCREIPVHHEMVPRVVESAVRSARKKRPHTTTSESTIGTRDKQKLMELRPEWMGSNFLKQRNQSHFSLANEYHGYSSGWDSVRSDKKSVSRRSSICSSITPRNCEVKDQGTNTPIFLSAEVDANLGHTLDQGCNTMDMA